MKKPFFKLFFTVVLFFFLVNFIEAAQIITLAPTFWTTPTLSYGDISVTGTFNYKDNYDACVAYYGGTMFCGYGISWYISIDGGSDTLFWQGTPPPLAGDASFSGTITSLVSGSHTIKFSYVFTALVQNGNLYISSGSYPPWSFTVNPPAAVATPVVTGPTTGYTGTNYQFTYSSPATSGVTNVKYGIDWTYTIPFGGFDLNTINEYFPTTFVPIGVTQTVSHLWDTPGSYPFVIKATASSGATSSWSLPHTIVISLPVGSPPTTPIITGPISCRVATNCTYSFISSTSGGATVKYGIDWDNNGSVDVYVPAIGFVTSATSQSVLHSWATIGTYTFQVRAVDSNGFVSGWAPKTVVVGAPPSVPVITGPSTCVTTTNCSYSFVSTTIGGATVRYQISWYRTSPFPDQTTSYFVSGTPQAYSHSWTPAATYMIFAKALDSNSFTSAWSAPYTVNVNDMTALSTATPVSVKVSSTNINAGDSVAVIWNIKDPDNTCYIQATTTDLSADAVTKTLELNKIFGGALPLATFLYSVSLTHEQGYSDLNDPYSTSTQRTMQNAIQSKYNSVVSSNARGQKTVQLFYPTTFTAHCGVSTTNDKKVRINITHNVEG